MVKYIFLVISAICCIDLSQFWLVVHTVVIHSTGIQFALVCPTEFWFFAQPFKSVATQNVQQPCTVAFGLQMPEIVTSIFRVKIQIQYNLTLLLQIYLEGRISKNFWISIYFWRFTSVGVREGRWRCFQPFLLIYISSSFFLPTPKTNPKHHIVMTKYNNPRMLRKFITSIPFWKRFADKRIIP